MGYNIKAGKRHGNLTVVRELDRHNGHRMFKAKCDCGAVVKMRESHFYPERRFCSHSCPLLREHRLSDLAGKKIGRWRVVEYSGQIIVGGKERAGWKCRCKCGTERVLNGEMITSGGSRSCGCLMIEAITRHKTPEAKLKAKRAASRKCARGNPARMKANKIKYLAKLSKATPAWLTTDQWNEMNAFYGKARQMTKATGIRHEVDHIVPINGVNVSGLHVPWNLQVLTQAENVAKSNRYAELSGD